MNLIQRLANSLPVPYSYCGYCQCLHHHSEINDEPNGAAYCGEPDDIMWNGKYTPNDSNYVFGCNQIRFEIQEQYAEQWNDYYSGIGYGGC